MDLMRRVRIFDRLASDVQSEITAVFRKDADISARLDAFAKLPGNVTQDQLNKVVVDFINAIPFADVCNINLFTTALTHHTGVTGNPTLLRMASIINEEVTNRMADDLYAKS